jgi:hypothetical protein
MRGHKGVYGRAGIVPAATASLMRSIQDTTARFIASSVFEESLHITSCYIVLYCIIFYCYECYVMISCVRLYM